MPRNVITTITPFDYLNFRQEFSEKNIINQTSGTEYVIDAASITNIVDINNTPLSVDVNPLGGGNAVNVWKGIKSEVRGIFARQVIQGKDEYYRTSGTITIETDEIITDLNAISIDVVLKYDKYHTNSNVVSDSNYASSNSAYKQIMTSANKTNDDYLTAREKLPYETSLLDAAFFDLFGWKWDFGIGKVYLSSTFPTNYISYKCKKLPNDHYQIIISYSIVTWWGKNYVMAGKWSQTNSADLWVVRNMEFTVKANTVSAHELEFGYSRNEENSYTNAHGKNYEINSNEFLQTDENTNHSERQSNALSQLIFDGFDNDRAIVSFILLNCEKYLINGEKRYLQAEDLIYIQDSDGSTISDDVNSNGVLVPSVFEIIKTRPIWDGSFSMEIVCRKIDMTT